MTPEQNEIYLEGYVAGTAGLSDDQNPHSGIDAEFWSDGHEDGSEDLSQVVFKNRRIQPRSA